MALDTKTLDSLTPEQRKKLAEKLKNKAASLKSYPMSFAQQRLWMLFQLDPESAAYNIPMTVKLTGALDVELLKKALNSLMQRHAVLRTRFATIKAKPLQIVVAEGKLDFVFEDIRSVPADQRDNVIKQHVQKAAATPFDLTKLPLYCVRLYQTGADEHVLLINMHHIISDGWSVKIFVGELTQLYLQLEKGLDPKLLPLKIQYADFSVWQRKHFQGETLEKLLGYWTEKLAGLSPVLDLPTDFPRPHIKGARGGAVTHFLPDSLKTKLSGLIEKSGVTPFIFYLTAWQAFLHRLTNQDDIAVGTPIANRNRKEIEPLIGFFVNSLVIRGLFDNSQTFMDFLQQTKQSAFEAYANQDVPFEMIVEKLAPERDMSRTPLYQVSFSYDEFVSNDIQTEKLKLTPFEVAGESAKFDMATSVTLDEKDLACTIVYDAELFERATIERMLEQFHVLLHDVASNPEKRVQDLSILPDDQIDAILANGRSERADYPQTPLFHQGVEAWAQKTPDAIAVAFEDDTLTFSQLNKRANKIAHYLRRQNIGPEDFVGLYMDRSLETIIALLAIIKAGAAYIPSDSKYPRDRLAFMYNGRVKTILTLENVREHLVDIDESIPVIALDANAKMWDNESAENPESKTLPQHPAYAIFTSGSTGTPKGVVVQHNGLLNLAYNLKETVYDDLDVDNARISLNAPLAFDASVQQVVMLMFGHGLYIVPEDYRADGRALRQFVARHQLHVVDCVPSQLKVMVQEKFLDDDLWRPQAMLPGGEAIDEGMWKTIAQSDIRFFNMYGPTECTVDSTIYPVLPDQEKPVIGKAVKNADFYVLDPRGNLLPVGVPGELYIAGAGLARGYLDRPELTAERFVPDPYSETAGARMYKTGDLVRLLADGQIDFLGRTDFQVKVRGFRIELEEIEHAIRKYPTIQDVLVLVHQDAASSQSIVAYIVSEKGDLDTTELRDSLRSSLPNYMIPAAFVLLEKFPLLPNGKINRHALPKADYADVQDEFVEPSTPTEEALAAIFIEVLELDTVSARANFFEIGGHSLLATQVLSRIREVFKLEMPLRALFEHSNVIELARAVDLALLDNSGQQRPPIEPAPTETTLPLSFAQQRMWFLDQLEPKNPQYNIPSAVRMRGHLDIEILTACLQTVVDRHQVLRTAFKTVDGSPQLTVLEQFVVQIPITDISDVKDKESRAQELVLENAKTGFDLSAAPLFRLNLIKLDENDYILASTMHHSISDGWSSGVLMREVGILYDRLSRGDNTPLPTLPIQYSDFSYWQRNWLHGERLEKEIEYWRTQLGGSDDVLELPTDRKRPSFQTTNGAHLNISFSKELTAQINALSGKENTTLFMTLLAAFQTLLYRYTHQDAIAVGSPIANRNQSEIENLIGFFVNTLVLKTDLSGNPTFRDLLQRVKEVTLGAYAHQDVPFEKLVDALQPNRDTSHTPLFQVMFLLQNITGKRMPFEGVEFEQLDIETSTSNFDLTLVLEEHDHQLVGAFEYNTDLFDVSTIQSMGKHLTLLLEAIVADPDVEIADYQLLPQAEEKLLAEWNDTAVEFDMQPIHQLIEKAVSETPDSIAVKSGDKQLTYAELDSRANQVANYLVQQNVKPDDLVGICIDRSLEMIIGLVGILKSGAGYLPLDPNYPTERIEYMLGDANVSFLLTEDKLKTSLPGDKAKLVCLDSEWNSIADESTDNPNVPVDLNNLAYVIYTSGSTGTPKGVLVTHEGVVNHNHVIRHDYNLTPDDNQLQFFSLNFDGAVEEIFPTLMSGATLVLRPPGVVMAVDEYLKMVEKEQISFLDMPTAYWHELAYELDTYDKELPSCARFLLTGGEAASPERYAQWKKRVPAHMRWINTYGPTEGSIIATQYDPAENESHDMSTMLIGKPLSNYKIYILDGNLKQTPIGVPGELCIGGAGVVRGYLNRPDLTAEKFIPDAWSDGDGARIYRTGDLARWLPDGNIEFIGRVDDQVKIRGFRVELGEIESHLNKHADIRESIVLARTDGGKDKKLVAYFATENNVEISQSDLREFLKQHMPDYMVPHVFMQMDELPKMISGKIDRKALPQPDFEDVTGEEISGEPQNENEEKLLAIFKDILGHEAIGTQNNFFELGGDSIMSIQVIAKANQAGIKLTPKQLFENPTVKGLAAVAGKGTAVVAQQAPSSGPLLLTPIMRWFFEQKFVSQHHWNQSVLLHIDGQLDAEALQKALTAVQGHHDIFQLHFTPNDSSWDAAFTHAGDTKVETYDFSASNAEEQKIRVEETCTQVQKKFNLEKGGLFSSAYINLGDNSRLFIAVHHLAMDGVSWRIVLEDVRTAYEQAARGEQPTLPAKTTSFQYWAEKLNAYAATTTAADEAAYWTHYERQLVAPLPVDVSPASSGNSEATAENIGRSLDRQETKRLLQDLPGELDAGINDLLLTALVQAFFKWTGKPSLLIDMEGHGRENLFDDVDLSRTVGWFTSLYPLLLKTERNASLRESIRSVKKQLQDIPRNGIGYGVLRYLSSDDALRAKLAAMPQPQISFNYLGQFDQLMDDSSPFKPAREFKGEEHSRESQRENLIDVTAIVSGEQLHTSFTFNKNVHNSITIKAVLDNYVEAILAMINGMLDEKSVQAQQTLGNLNKRQMGKVLGQLNKKGKRF